MFQEIVVIIIVGGAFIWVGVRILRNISNKDEDPCNGCGSSCNSCAINDLKKEIEQKQLEKLKKDDALDMRIKN
ncbi:MAG TPA: hypothetical protein DCR43_02340 [Bacteroidales bacterium]|nr:MAG: hypothetical protein A2X11_07550 [Bacteroidetes bacterium GWE2_42_24]OFY29488.1 MAG: hypothetical protein A2X09_04050 [Bacteroidetes bacterium GWF2_43_11]PKP27272.1 MAG: hypothetical protein CVU06_02715 [Bacteroidetes bacterium HGW-Bacteroidetes-22]HAQ64688.1 hypothetical protein [Bacteroidales bacterium]HBZ67283.1 hypothetical protein [Bacteroidales bacterium]